MGSASVQSRYTSEGLRLGRCARRRTCLGPSSRVSTTTGIRLGRVLGDHHNSAGSTGGRRSRCGSKDRGGSDSKDQRIESSREVKPAARSLRPRGITPVPRRTLNPTPLTSGNHPIRTHRTCRITSVRMWGKSAPFDRLHHLARVKGSLGANPAADKARPPLFQELSGGSCPAPGHQWRRESLTTPPPPAPLGRPGPEPRGRGGSHRGEDWVVPAARRAGEVHRGGESPDPA
jgi:hypothetical protein